jgi:hypothetical protein
MMEIVTSAPLKIPAEPAPEMARPTIKTADDGATADTSEPISKTKKPVRNVYLMENKAYSLPKRGTRAAEGRVKAEPYQPTSLRA